MIDNTIAKIRIGPTGLAWIVGDDIPRDREIIIKSLERLLDWLKTHEEPK